MAASSLVSTAMTGMFLLAPWIGPSRPELPPPLSHPDALPRHGPLHGQWLDKTGSKHAIGTATTASRCLSSVRSVGRRIEQGYDWAYESFYSWRSIFEASRAHESAKASAQTFLLQRRLEEIRTRVGSGDQDQTVVSRCGQCLRRYSRPWLRRRANQADQERHLFRSHSQTVAIHIVESSH